MIVCTIEKLHTLKGCAVSFSNVSPKRNLFSKFAPVNIKTNHVEMEMVSSKFKGKEIKSLIIEY